VRPVSSTVLLFGFEPFLEFEENPSQLIVESLDGRKLPSGEVVRSVVLPVAYDTIEEKIMKELRRETPRLALGVGVASGRNKVTPEKIAVNYKRTEKPDNSGKVLVGERIDLSGPDGIFSNLDVEGLVEALNKDEIPAKLSLSAGSYLCNNAMYVIVREALKGGFGGGFVHIPCHSEYAARKPLADSASLPLSVLKKAIEMSIDYFLG
jgi:pyroglutamyl-peptidase